MCKVLKDDKLNLPIIKGALPAARILSMDDYVKFVTLNLKYIVDKRTVRKQKKLAAVNMPFSLR
jgi:hypothetical protein